MPWGRYKDRQISDVPTDYLTFVLPQRFGTSDDRMAFLEELQRRDPGRFCAPLWEECVNDLGDKP